jgi:hybrid polyketide synthase/nonribosomal peptide synthetase ACE1
MLCLGRKDNQVKIRGLRVELGEIEHHIKTSSLGAQKQAVEKIFLSGDIKMATLAAFVVPPAEYIIDDAQEIVPQTATLSAKFLELKEHIARSLSSYMVPLLYIPLRKMPETQTNKIDRKALRHIGATLTTEQIKQYSLSREENNSNKLAPSTQMEIALQSLWAELLCIEPITICADDSFFSKGGDSIKAMRLASLAKAAGIKLIVADIFNNPVLCDMATVAVSGDEDATTKIKPFALAPAEAVLANAYKGAIEEQISSQPTTVASIGSIDWVHETAVTDDLSEININSESNVQRRPFKTVVITGATGFLGKELIRQMIDNTRIEKIHAIAVRRRKEELPAIFSHPKVELNQGDLSTPLLGLTPAKAKAIFAEAAAVIHNGADVSFFKTYKSLSKANFGSTRELIKLCLPSRVQMHFISSAGVAHLSGRPSFGEESVAAFEPPTDGTDGYTATKWASERFLEVVSEKFNLPIWIHRPSSITGQGAPDLDLMTNLLTYAKRLRTVPVSQAWKGTLDFVSVERVASEILDEVGNDNPDSSELIKYIHESGDIQIQVEDMQASLEEQTKQNFQAVELNRWTAMAVEEGLDELVAAYLTSSAKMPIFFPKLEKGN